jgi:5-hydroxyisourate hydrolase-like protein (transthyretin family)
MEEVRKIKFLIGFGICLILGALPSAGRAATLYLAPANGTYKVGDTITVNVYVSSADQAMNAASAVLSFHSDKLEATAVSKSGSIFSMMVQEPGFSNNDGHGTARFEGVVMNPGYTGSRGKLISVTFKVKDVGSTSLAFASGSVLANDGLGTSILTGMGSANFNLIAPGAQPPETPPTPTPPVAPETRVPPAPVIRSSSHPDPGKWYSQKTAILGWNIPSGVDQDRVLVGNIPDASPNVAYKPAINSREITDLADGTWYFHAQLHNSKGWGGISHFAFNIDTAPPSQLNVAEVPRSDRTDPRASFTITAEDAVSGIDHFEIRLDANATTTWNDDGSHTYALSLVTAGEHTLEVKAFDKAGNHADKTAAFTVEAPGAPTITEFPGKLKVGEALIIKGVAAPDQSVTIWLQYNNEAAVQNEVKTDHDGRFAFANYGKLETGDYAAWAQVTNNWGAKSAVSNKAAFKVVPLQEVNVILLVIVIVVLLLLLLILTVFHFVKIFSLRKKILAQTRLADRVVHESLDAYRERMRMQIIAPSTPGAKKESAVLQNEKMIKQLDRRLDDVEQKIRREIKVFEKLK